MIRNECQRSTKLFRRQVYEAARRNQSIDIDMVLPQILTRNRSKKTRRFVNYKSTDTQRSLENLMNISQVGETKGSMVMDKDEVKSITDALEKEEDGEGSIDQEKYKYLNEAKGFTINELENDKDDSFLMTTKA